MTWDELKSQVDEYLKQKGRDGQVSIWYVDWKDRGISDKIHVNYDPKLGLSIAD